jgi:maltose O-acetyltransferase
MTPEYQKMISGEAYLSADPELVQMRLQARLITERYNATSAADVELRSRILRELFGEVGEGAFIEPNFRCDYGRNIRIGKRFYANFDCVILDVAPVTIGDNCFFGPQVGVYTASHPLDPAERASGKEFGYKIAIGNDCWIGGHATINPGVTLGNGVVVASGAVVTKSFGDRVVLAGVPARVVKTI